MQAQWKNEWKNYYEILGIDKSVTIDEIKKAHRKKSRECHPDLNPNVDPNLIKLVNEAYDVLSKEQTRSEYDEELNNKLNKKSASSVKKESVPRETKTDERKTYKPEPPKKSKQDILYEQIQKIQAIWNNYIIDGRISDEEQYQKIVEELNSEMAKVQVEVMSLVMEKGSVDVRLFEITEKFMHSFPKNLKGFNKLHKEFVKNPSIIIPPESYTTVKSYLVKITKAADILFYTHDFKDEKDFQDKMQILNERLIVVKKLLTNCTENQISMSRIRKNYMRVDISIDLCDKYIKLIPKNLKSLDQMRKMQMEESATNSRRK